MKIFLRPIHDQVVVLVGATSGIGLETAMLMAEKGASVVIVGRSQEGLNEAFERTRARAEASHMARAYGEAYGSRYAGYGREEAGRQFAGVSPEGMPVGETSTATMTEQVTALEGDITSFDDMRRVAEQVIQRYGRIDTWVNLAAVSEWALFEDTSPEEFRRIIDVNLTGHAFAAMAALPYLRQQQASALIFVSSVAGRLPIPYQSAYNASKHGLLGMIDTMRMELEHSSTPVSVTSIMPASVNTPLFDKARTKIGVEPEPIPPVYDTTMVARAILHAAQHPVRELIVGDAGHMMMFMRRFSPGLASRIMGAIGFSKQRSDQPKSAQAPDNLYEHISGYNEESGDFTYREKHFAPLTYLSTHPRARMALWGGMLALLGGLVGWRMVKARAYRRSWRYRLPREAQKIMKMAAERALVTGKSTSKQLNRAGKQITNTTIMQKLPMFHQPSLLERAGDALTGVWAALIALAPFQRRHSLARRIFDRLPEIHSPLHRRNSMTIDRKHIAKRLSKTGKQIGKAGDRVKERIGDTSGKVRERVGETGEKVRERFVARGKDDTRVITSDTTKEMTEVKPHLRRHRTIVEEVRIRK